VATLPSVDLKASYRPAHDARHWTMATLEKPAYCETSCTLYQAIIWSSWWPCGLYIQAATPGEPYDA
jgi:hypothetical protein